MTNGNNMAEEYDYYDEEEDQVQEISGGYQIEESQRMNLNQN